MANAPESEREGIDTGVERPDWIILTNEQIIELIVNMGKKGVPPSQIGMVLRDVHGVPSVETVFGKRMVDILSEHGMAPQIPEDLVALLKKAYSIRKHMEGNRRDFHSKRGLMITESKIRRLAKYYRRVGKLPRDWRFDPERLEIMIT